MYDDIEKVVQVLPFNINHYLHEVIQAKVVQIVDPNNPSALSMKPSSVP